MEQLTGIDLIITERKEQVEKHGYSVKRDARYYKKGQLIQAAVYCLLLAFKKGANISVPEHPQGGKWPKGWNISAANKIYHKDAVGQLKVAGAFYMAENERLGIGPMPVDGGYTKDIYDIAKAIDEILNS